MAYDPSGLFDELESQLAASGWQTGQIGEPKSPPAERLGAVIFDGVEITEATLASASGLVKFIIRLYYSAFEEPPEGMEKDIARATLQAVSDICGRYQLGDSSVRNIMPVNMIVRAGYQEIGRDAKAMYRVVDLFVHALVNDLGTFASVGTTAIAYNPACTLTAAINATGTAALYTSTGDPISKWDIIQVDTEKMVVIAVNVGSNLLTIGRGYDSTADAHLINAPILKWGSL
jgi:hypothetical protein